MDTISLKKYIFENNKIEFILNEIGCHSITYHQSKDFFSCGNYNGDNKGAINVKNNEYLNVINWTRTKDFDSNSDIISLVQYNKKLSFREALKYLHEILNLEFTWQKKSEKKKNVQKDIFLMESIRNQTKYGIVNVDDIKTLDEEFLNDYIPLLHIDFLKQGVMPWTRKKFGLCYSYKYKRVVIPIRYWLTGELVATNMRTTVENWEEFNIKKYYLTTGYNKSLNLFGLYENYDSIQKAGYVVVYEAEKSVLKRDSLNDATGVAVSGHTLSEEQASILWGLNVEIVFAFDKDIRIEEVWHLCEKICKGNGRRVSYIQDKWDILSSKDSPADASNKDYQFLFNNRIVYDKSKQHRYKESLKKK